MFMELLGLEERHGQYESSFDYWQATISLEGWSTYDSSTGEPIEPAENLVKWLSSEITMVDVVRSRGTQSYRNKVDFNRGKRTICTLQWGGVNPDPNITATGSDSPFIRKLVTSRFHEGKISRVDSAYDSLSGTSEFLRVCAWAESRASRLRINCKWIKNSDKSIGDTLYIGSKSSRVQIRIYEKGKQTGYKPGEWWRAEVQLRPDSRSKKNTYRFSSGMVWSTSEMTRDLWHFLGGERLYAFGFLAPPDEKDLEQRAFHLAYQYGNLLSELLSVSGSPSAVFERFDRVLSDAGKSTISDRVKHIPMCPF